MKTILLSLCCLLVSFNIQAQSNVVDFTSAMTSKPNGKKILVMDVIYDNGNFESIQEKVVRCKKSNQKFNNKWDKIGAVIDGLGLIDYKNDTIYILSTYYIPDTSTSYIFNTRRETFYLVKNSSGEYEIRYMDDYYAELPFDIKESDSLLYSVIFSWDIEMLIQLIKSSGGLSGNEYSASATRIILKDNQVSKKDMINFKPAIRWHLDN